MGVVAVSEIQTIGHVGTVNRLKDHVSAIAQGLITAAQESNNIIAGEMLYNLCCIYEIELIRAVLQIINDVPVYHLYSVIEKAAQ